MATQSVSCVRDVREASQLLQQLTAEEENTSKELEHLLEQQSQLDLKMALFQHILSSLKTMESEAGALQGVIGRASQLAESVSCKVRVLDQAKSRVYGCMKRVDDVIDLKSCVDGVQFAMTTGDYEKAAAHIHRYLALDENILLETTADSTKGGSTVSSSFSLLRDAETKLKELVRTSMADAMATSDHAQVERFFKIFPLLNLHKEGLQLFSSHLRRQIRESSDASLEKASQPSEERVGVVYADTLTLLYEALARCLESNQPMVETYYGPHWMPLLIRELQAECDEQCSRILEQLHAERLLDHKVQTVSIALNSRTATGAIRPDVLELDALLSELSLCCTRTQLYFRFLLRRASTAGDSWTEGSEGRGESVEELLRTCRTSQLEQELMSKYILIEDYFMRESLCKAVAMDTCNPDGCTSSMADDIFFVLQKCTRRAFSSGNVDGACAVLNNASSLLLTEYKNQLQLRLQTSSTVSTSLDLTGMLQGKSRGPERRENEVGGASYMVALNDVEVSIDNIQKLASELQVEAKKLGAAAADRTKRKLDSCVADFSSVTTSFKELRQTGVASVVRSVLVPALQPAVSVFSSFSHILSEEDFTDYEVNDPFVQQLLIVIEKSLSDVKVKLISAVFEHVFSEMTTELAVLLEQQILTCEFNQLGGVQLDKDLRSLTSYLSSLTSWPVRDRFTRLMQIATLLTLETVNELFDYWGGSILWRLTPSEVRRVLHLRTEFRTEDVERIKLQ